MIRALGGCVRGSRQWQPLLWHQQLVSCSTPAAASSAADEAHSESGIIVVPMPALSHSMVSGKVARWLKQEGEACEIYDLLLEVETETLVEEAYRLDDFAGKVTLLLETQEEVHVAKLLVQEGQDVPVGTPIAVLCEDPDQLEQAVRMASQIAKVGSVYQSDGQFGGSLRTLVWQSYLKESKKEGPGGSCGCM